MKRNHFLRTITAMAGGLTVVSCSTDLLSDLVDEGQTKDISIEEAKKWFNEAYLPSLNTTDSKDNVTGAPQRKAKWDNAQIPPNKENKQFIWVPIDYDSEARPTAMVYDEDTKFKLELKKYFQQPILEGLIIVKEGTGYRAFLSQLAYDPIWLASNKYKIEKSTFTGTVLHSDWNDNVIEGAMYENGKFIRRFSNGTSSNLRIADCQTFHIAYQWVTVNVGGILYPYPNVKDVTLCSDTSGSPGSGGGVIGSGPYYTGPEGSYFDPLIFSGAGTGYFPGGAVSSFNIPNAITSAGSDRNTLIFNLQSVMSKINLIDNNIALMNFTRADALCRAIGGSVVDQSQTIMLGVINTALIKGSIDTKSSMGIVNVIIRLSINTIMSDTSWNSLLVSNASSWGTYPTGFVVMPGVAASSAGPGLTSLCIGFDR